MKQLKELSELEGKTITSARIFNNDEGMAIFFGDEYMVISASTQYDCAELDTNEELSAYEMLNLEMISKAECDLLVKAERLRSREAHKEQELKTRAYLNEKYGPKA